IHLMHSPMKLLLETQTTIRADSRRCNCRRVGQFPTIIAVVLVGSTAPTAALQGSQRSLPMEHGLIATAFQATTVQPELPHQTRVIPYTTSLGHTRFNGRCFPPVVCS